jgi:hypothetical protein
VSSGFLAKIILKKLPKMTVTHYVLFKFKEDAPMDLIKKRFHELQAIKGVSNMAFGKTFTDRGKGYTHILSLDFVDRVGLDAYANHPDHVKFVEECIKPFQVEGALAMDIEK